MKAYEMRSGGIMYHNDEKKYGRRIYLFLVKEWRREVGINKKKEPTFHYKINNIKMKEWKEFTSKKTCFFLNTSVTTHIYSL